MGEALVRILFTISEAILYLAVLLLLLRLLLQLARADFYNPISQGIVQITEPVLRPLRMVVPGYRTFDGPPFTAAVVFSMLMFAVASRFGFGVLLLLLLGLEHTLQMMLTIYWFAILIVIVLSFLAPMTIHPAALLARQIVEPVLAPARRLLPPFSGLDLSPLLVFFAIFAARELLAAFFQTLRAAVL